MSQAAELLVIILSIVLTIFLVFGTILMVYLIKLTRQANRIADSAERTVDGFEVFIANLTKAVSPVIITDAIAKVIRSFKKDKKANSNEEEA